MIDSGLQARRSIQLSYSQLRSAISDLVWSGRSHEAWQKSSRGYDSQSDIVEAARKTLAAQGLEGCRLDSALAAIRLLERSAETLAPLLHGFAEVRETRRSGICFCFRFRRRQQHFTLAELLEGANRLAIATNAAVDALVFANDDRASCELPRSKSVCRSKT